MSVPASIDSVRSPNTATFAAFRAELPGLSTSRSAVVASYRKAEAECLTPLLDLAKLPAEHAARAAATARRLVENLRAKTRGGGVEGLIHEYSLSSQEGVALMCLAEALLRIPDKATRDTLIRDKISTGDWRRHVGRSPSVFVNAATWGLVITGRLTTTTSESSLSSALTRLIGRGGEPLIRKGVDLAMRLMGEQFVTGQTITEALANSRRMESRGFRYSYDMLGEAATTAEDAARYFASYEDAIRAIGKASSGKDVYDGAGISIKLSALHPRYVRAKRNRVLSELVPRVKALAKLAQSYNIGMNIDAEEADRLDLSLDILEALVADVSLAGWNGIGFVIQAYGKRCSALVDYLIALGRQSGRRLMVRLVKGAYWDSEIKRAQVDGLQDFPVFTRKIYTDVSYLACARKLLAAPEAVFPQFATHNAQTLATIVEMGGPNFYSGQYEFQCLHGMGEPLYEAVVGAGKLNRPCRIYAPVGTHETLLAYLVRRLLENGANSSFVNRIADENVPIEALIADPVATVMAMPLLGAPHEKIALPRDIYGSDRANAFGLDLSDEFALAALADELVVSENSAWVATPSGRDAGSIGERVRNPADRDDVVGSVVWAEPGDIEQAVSVAAAAAAGWAATQALVRAEVLNRAADAFEQRMPILLGLIVREAGKSLPNAIAEVREAVDFLRYYSAEVVRTLGADFHAPLGPVVCISPWNFPLAIFTGQVAAALAAGNTVLAKPAEETPLIAAEAVRILLEAGVPDSVLQFLPGAGQVGAALVADQRVQGVLFTGSMSVARLIQRRLSDRLSATGRQVPLIAETGGQNALIVDSSALAEQVVGDVVASAFDSAGQRCSALRILCLQEDVADRTLQMLKGAFAEFEVGDPRKFSVDVGPVISAEAAETIERHVTTMEARGHRVHRRTLGSDAAKGTFVAPAIIEISRISDVENEVFGPVLHVLRFNRTKLDALVDEINATGYGLTFGVHTRIDETISRIVSRIEAGNIYVNRNIIGAVVGVQPFGGSGLSGTGPKAGGPLYLGRLLGIPPQTALRGLEGVEATFDVARSYVDWLRRIGRDREAERTVAYLARSVLGAKVELPGPVGERNVYSLRPRGRVAVVATTASGLLLQLALILATGNTALVESDSLLLPGLSDLPPEISARIEVIDSLERTENVRAVLYEGDTDDLRVLNREVAERPGPIVPVYALTTDEIRMGVDYDLTGLLEECSVSVNTAAAGGNASLMSIG
ncbi:trifunctional transcriptional regulator/proline dehydrogenase/L-glutamate gamma-semialdehyde dehydrogenase [Methylobacterium sp. J-077]|uniref:trifunctional transcriptional regulator/proline dehydrogenase/L-glutamate gamma-semialdehyde dehydrogenase n=1 Tax=Methylobacterium sp. J-077 TaxID=2836656 RepID=UPI001FBB146D|nr:trifunctional transcriptional regulator/proline dehydrogenase/L-glutamate gamma-semialdehyde dehydrogenase [Methylobacterium sp. J-077]MCJ2121198.1 trifunctional transcriptional regulator/proline dehydrogenase/L-glutamate gamma-semialdehyde dehydrogenase [Methylobacterium sp. J-077]